MFPWNDLGCQWDWTFSMLIVQQFNSNSFLLLLVRHLLLLARHLLLLAIRKECVIGKDDVFLALQTSSDGLLGLDPDGHWVRNLN